MTPVELAQAIERRYRAYLQTTFHFRDPVLRESFRAALESGRLSKGPFLEGTPLFRRSYTPRQLFPGLLGFTPDEGFLQAVQADRRLFVHQEQAIRRVDSGRNVVVATGTGSGKTEAFLYPILLHMYREHMTGTLQTSGVRALILYPMNALANDQRERLAGKPSEPGAPGGISWVLRQTSSPFRFTFGQYIGETPKDKTDSRRLARQHMENRLESELVLRAEMWETPPHILLTNYSMLEYLLLRPEDSPLFDDGASRWWTFIVLDEVHQYGGARGMEMAMLLRRLKHRLRQGGCAGPFRCIATSATLAGGAGDREAVAAFASELFGEPFEADDVILGEAEPIDDACGAEEKESERPSIVLSRADYDALSSFMDERGAPTDVVASPGLAAIAAKLGVPTPQSRTRAGILWETLRADHRAVALRGLITGKALAVSDVADRLFWDLQPAERIPVLAQLVELMLRAEDPRSGGPLLSARYHLFLRSLEGAWVKYWPRKAVLLERHAAGQDGGAAFEVALCRECGQHYLVTGKGFAEGRLTEPVRDPSQVEFGATFLRPMEDDQAETEDDQADVDSADRGRGRRGRFLHLCIRCGIATAVPPYCGHGTTIRLVKEPGTHDERRADQISKCGVCGYSASGRDPVREVVHGADAPHVVVATTLHQNLDAKHRKVLAFADSRQDAAFFAWYLERSYQDILSRNVLYKTLRNLSQYEPGGLSLRELAKDLCSLAREVGVFPASRGTLENKADAWKWLWREFMTDEPRISIEGVGLARWRVRWPPYFSAPLVLTRPPWSLDPDEALELVLLLLDSLRLEKAVELRMDPGLRLPWQDLELSGVQQRVTTATHSRLSWGEVRWAGSTGRRTWLLVRLLAEVTGSDTADKGVVDAAVEALRQVLVHLVSCDERSASGDSLLIHAEDAFRLNPDWWRLQLIPDDGTVCRCETCGRVQGTSVRGVCSRYRCKGHTTGVPASLLSDNHYRVLYSGRLPGRLRVEEHTAQLSPDKAREFQRSFRSGEIHVLSSSTTFELGVDLGDLDTVFLRNVPPEPFNYAQRVGRAGRRRGRSGFAVTYCRRGPHDLYHFTQPQRMLSGMVRPPVLVLRNEKIVTRHMMAVCLSRFFRASDCESRFEDVGHLFGSLTDPRFLPDFRAFLDQHRDELESDLRSVVPQCVTGAVGLEDGSWVDKVAGPDSRLALAEAEIASDYASIKKLQVRSSDVGKPNYRLAEWAREQAEGMEAEDVTSYLSRKALIPKYGFPVDVVALDVRSRERTEKTASVSLQRDLSLAIAEFAPTSRLVANKLEWVSCGLKRVAGREWDRWWYVKCDDHNRFERRAWRGEEVPPTIALPCCGLEPMAYQYVDPRFGFVTDLEGPDQPKRKPARMFTTRPYFADFRDKPGDVVDLGPVILTPASPGFMVVLCEGRGGQGFYICGVCGAGFDRPAENHKTPLGQTCKGALSEVALGHEFVTDVLELRFKEAADRREDPLWFSYSLAFALLGGAAEVLQVPLDDLNATVGAADGGSVPPIILYDTVPGGAGLVAKLQERDELQRCIEVARDRAANCPNCGEDSSCYTCLRSYGNQFAHKFLRRGPVAEYLGGVLAGWKRGGEATTPGT